MSIRNALLGLLLSATLSAALGAQGITIPNTFVNGTAADATQVNANFTSLANNALNRTGGTMTGTLTTVLVQPTVTNTSDIGTTSLLYRTGYVRTSLVLGQAAGNYTVTWANPAAARAISFEDPGGTDILVYKAATQTLTNKTLTSPAISGPVLSGTVTGTYTLGGTPSYGTITSGVWNAGAVTSSGAFVGVGALTITGAPNGAAGISLAAVTTGAPTILLGNASTGTLVGLNANNTKDFQIWTNANARLAAMAFASGGVDIGNGGVDPGANNLRVAGTSTLTGNVLVGGTNITDAVTTPTISSGCGAGATISGKVYGFRINLGTGAFASCTVNFNTTFSSAPACVVTGNDLPQGFVATGTNTTSVTVQVATAFTASSTVHVVCRGF